MDGKLDDILAFMLKHDVRIRRSLSGGLHLAYTPKGFADNERFTLTLSREGVDPSTQEVKTTKEYLLKALKMNHKATEGFDQTAVKKAGKYHYTRLYWDEIKQRSLI